MDGQPNYLKFVVKFIFDTFQEFEREVASELGGSYSLKATIEEFKRLTRANLQLAKWAEAGHVPSFDEYLKVAGIEIAVDFTLFGILVAMKDICKEEAVAWLKCRNKLAILMHTVGRVRNDIFGLKDDMSRGYVTNSINCYKKQYGVTEEEAIRKLHEIVADAHKMINEELLKPINVPRKVLNAMATCGRMVFVSYETDDQYTRPGGKFKNDITSMYLDL
ncbi:unnamed protein product [Eruca vesicaria subsp. sativa]|uniref:Terpene synthase metal-binding domain-containing protein n=1 Tax=Eruca vesicaria subsp. sativa TaxID=29727 RepID=A0ABC8KZI0_ERUVS|nr:unnamed protein product [Eruca vesicaria subsp. sativa]